MSIASNLVTQSLRNNGLSGYVRHAEPVIRDLDTALDGAVRSLVSAGVRLGATTDQIEEALIEAGLMERPAPEPEPTVEQAVQGGDQGLLERLVAFAQAHGFRG